MDDLTRHLFWPHDAGQLRAILEKWGVAFTERKRWWLWRQFSIEGEVSDAARRELEAFFADVRLSEEAW